MHMTLTNISIIKQTNPYYCIREKSKIAGVSTCLRTYKCHCLMSLFWYCSCYDY